MNIEASKTLIKDKRERGQSLTELAVSLTFIFILLAGVVDVGRAFFTYIAMRDAAQEGALYGSYYNSTGDANDTWCGIVKRTRDTSNKPFDLSSTTVRVKIGSNAEMVFPNGASPANPCPALGTEPSAGDEIKVGIDYDNFQISMPFLGTLIGSQTVPLSVSVKDTVISDTY